MKHVILVLSLSILIYCVLNPVHVEHLSALARADAGCANCDEGALIVVFDDGGGMGRDAGAP